MKTDDGRLKVISGASRSGKTAFVRQDIKGHARVFAWDPEDQWSQERGFKRVTTRAQLVALAKKKGQQKVAYVASGDLVKEFDFFCQAAFFAGRHVEPICLIAEELADVTTTSKAPNNWGMCTRRGLKRGITIYAISQRWAEADKTAFGNATDFVIFRASSRDDVRYLARKTMVEESEIEGLASLEYYTYDVLTKEKQRKKLTFRK